eukprot:CAMPEP_0170444244 /NCGR_PEP_ID=MMETSP0117_2-20130122/48421_1 /TAXON_ID=400756 /ORGANISM="Durinskia baltica, Strain CSIRO CS-38" /LENGTH=85 /DNA_ID=CAMNT_0010705033 /DNA_START=534 /DNA_END=791 /DNA_ORIENTATION=+
MDPFLWSNAVSGSAGGKQGAMQQQGPQAQGPAFNLQSVQRRAPAGFSSICICLGASCSAAMAPGRESGARGRREHVRGLARWSLG